MAKVHELMEKTQYPLYDAFFVPGEKNVQTEMQERGNARVMRFFRDIQNKTKLETNLTQSGVLADEATFEGRAMRVVTSSCLPITDDEANPITISDPAFLTDLIYNSVITLTVGTKVMIEVPTFFFPAGAGVSAGLSPANHGVPDPLATFRFAEPVVIDRSQTFRVDLEFPREIPQTVASKEGPLRIWVVLDGYLTRPVQ